MPGFWTESSAERTGSLLSRYAHAPWQRRRGAQPCSDSARTGGLSVALAAGTGDATAARVPPTHHRGGGVVTAETSQTLDRGLRVLKLLADTDHGLTVTELSNKLGVNRTVVYRLLATLEQHALVRRDLGGRARVGLGVLRLGRQVHPLRTGGRAARAALARRGHRGHRPPHPGRRHRGAGRRRRRADLDRLPRGLPGRVPPSAGPGRRGPGDPRRPAARPVAETRATPSPTASWRRARAARRRRCWG